MPRKSNPAGKPAGAPKRRASKPVPDAPPSAPRHERPSALLDTRVIYCGDCLDQLRKLPDACVDLIYIDPPFNSNRNYEVFWGDPSEPERQRPGPQSEPRPSGSGPLPPFEDRPASTAAYIDYMRPRCVELAGVLKKTGNLYYRCDGRPRGTYRRCERGARS